MIRWLLPPKSPKVSKYIECYWFIEKCSETQGYQFPKLNPDPSSHLIISPINQAYHYNMNPEIVSGKGSHWLFPHHQTLQLDHSKPFIHLGVKFHVGAIYSLDMSNYSPPLLDSVENVDLRNLLNSPEFSALNLLEMAQRDPSLCSEQLDTLLLPWLANCEEDRHSELTRKALRLIDCTPISEIGNMLYCSQRTLERSFNRVTGLTLKQCQAMNKLEAMLEFLYQRSASDIYWAEVAFKFGFSDQPHLIRYLKEQIGLTPKAYAKERGLTIDVYGGIKSS